MKFPLTLLPIGLLAAILPTADAAEFTLLEEGSVCDYIVPSVANGGSVLGLTLAGLWRGPNARLRRIGPLREKEAVLLAAGLP